MPLQSCDLQQHLQQVKVSRVFQVQSDVSVSPAEEHTWHTGEATALAPPPERDVHISASSSLIHVLGDRRRPLNDVCVPEVTGSSFRC